MRHCYSTIDENILTFTDIEEDKDGFSEDELMQMQEYTRNNSFLIWEIDGESKEKVDKGKKRIENGNYKKP